MSLADEKHRAFTTFNESGTPKPTPVWPVDAGPGRVGFITSSESWKVKRLANNNRVELQPSDARGNTKDGTPSTPGTAEVVDGADFEAVQANIRDKYGYQLNP